jgi:Fic family protein
MMDYADSPRMDDLDGRGNLSAKALGEFVEWFLSVALDQARFMSSMFDLDNLEERLRVYASVRPRLRPEASDILAEILRRGEMARGEAARVTGLAERTARNIVAELVADGIVASETPKGSISLRFSTASADILFPRLFPD